MQTDRPFVMSIAGFDPSGGAGVLADIKTFERLSVQGLSVLTAITLQTEDSFQKLQWLPIEEVVEAVETLLNRYTVRCVKIGIVPSAVFLSEIVKTIRSKDENLPIVWDTVLKSSSGRTFFSIENPSLLSETLSEINLITPNQPEFEFLSEMGVLNNLQTAVYQKGGHRTEKGEDILHIDRQKIRFLPSQTDCPPKHGSGCVLSSAITSYLAKGYDLENACRYAKIFIEKFLNSHPSLLGNYNF
ncbi:hydroxymethylpyrimidine/phosphomethylpyrimidine kinase [Capnocytophaga stomatis]|uniref:hydroxymethylpyrimidine kinase n=1 Tax=Capnocytophaga stomatis TaxID=1848904 RepID=A0ABW8QCQ7_9FLAO